MYVINEFMEKTTELNDYELRLGELKGSGLPEVIEFEGIKSSDVDRLMKPDSRQLAGINQKNVNLYFQQIKALRAEGVVPTHVIHGLVDSLMELNKLADNKVDFHRVETVSVDGVGPVRCSELNQLGMIHLKNIVIYQAQLEHPSPKWKNGESTKDLLVMIIGDEKSKLKENIGK